jgi:hypothetical protein
MGMTPMIPKQATKYPKHVVQYELSVLQITVGIVCQNTEI